MRNADVRRLRGRGHRGASSVEYALVAALIALVIIVGVTALGGATAGLFQTACSSIPTGTAATC